LWQDLIRAKYVHNKPVALANHKKFDFAYWFDILKVNQSYMDNGSLRVGNGSQTSFGDDAWCTSQPMEVYFSSLFEICNEKKLWLMLPL
jgi:hypothetical protein